MPFLIALFIAVGVSFWGAQFQGNRFHDAFIRGAATIVGPTVALMSIMFTIANAGPGRNTLQRRLRLRLALLWSGGLTLLLILLPAYHYLAPIPAHAFALVWYGLTLLLFTGLSLWVVFGDSWRALREAERLKAAGRNTCPFCAHILISGQTTCPECGKSTTETLSG